MRQVLVIAHVLGGLLMVFSLTFVLPLAWSLAAADGQHWAFVEGAAASLGAGALAWAATRRHRRELQPRDGFLLVVLSWIAMSAIATVPLLTEIDGLSFTDAFFETMSALTTTGATTLSGLDTLPPSVNVWRHALQWYGGMGIIVLAVAILPLLGVGGMQLFRAETPGPMKEGKLTPRITQTAKYLWLMYTGLTVLCVLALRAAGLDWYEALCHAFSAMALGGFSTRDASVMAFDSLAVELVLAAFMLLAVINFTTHFRVLHRRAPRAYLRDHELVWTLPLILGSALAVAAYLWASGTYPEASSALRHAFFNTVSVGTSSGYMSQDYAAWPLAASAWLLVLAAVGSSAGSTGGGIKMVRLIILVRTAFSELGRMIHPRAVRPICLGTSVVDPRTVLAVLGFMLLYGLTIAVLSFALLLSGLDASTAFTAVFACVNNLGPGLAGVGPAGNYASLDDLQTWICTLAMLAGRLELLTLFVLFTPAFWRK